MKQTNTTTRREIKQRRTQTMKLRKDTKENTYICGNHLFRLKEMRKMMQRNDLKPPLLDE